MMPHLAEECWQALGRDGLVAAGALAGGRPALLVEDEITLPVQVNGKKRADVTVPRDADARPSRPRCWPLEAVQRALEGQPPAR